MEFFSIMDLEPSYKHTVALSPYYIDFNIDRIMREIVAYWKEDVSALYKYFPTNEAGQEYRKDIYNDLYKEGVFECLMSFRDRMKQSAEYKGNRKQTRVELQSQVLALSEIKLYVEAVDLLAEELGKIKLESEGMNKLTKLLKDYVSGEEFVQLKEQAFSLRASLDAIPIKLTYQDHFINVSFEEVEGKYDAYLKACEAKKKDEQHTTDFFKRKNPFGDTVEITQIECEVLDIVCDRYPKIFAQLNQFINQRADYAEKVILQFAEELPFYLSYYTFEQVMKSRGLYFALAKKSENHRMCAEDLYDLALACQLSRNGEMPVANDTRMEEGENFFVLSGPNQGGKTTFARSLGQLIFFSKLGLPVPARRAEIPFYARILTHFSVEESVETGKGKLAEELSRLAPMMEDKTQKNDFVVINELFTTAANYDACIMGKRVLDHFIGQDCHGIYVTHLQDLSKEDKGIVSLRAMMNEEHKQNFKIVRSTDPALESSILLVEKHHLQYEQVIERLKGEASC